MILAAYAARCTNNMAGIWYNVIWKSCETIVHVIHIEHINHNPKIGHAMLSLRRVVVTDTIDISDLEVTYEHCRPVDYSRLSLATPPTIHPNDVAHRQCVQHPIVWGFDYIIVILRALALISYLGLNPMSSVVFCFLRSICNLVCSFIKASI